MRPDQIKTILSIVLIILLSSFGYAADNIVNACIGKNVAINLASNATTGYQWKLGAPFDNSTVSLIGSKYYAKRTGMMVGQGGVEVWKFKAIKKGKVKLLFKYLRPWEKGNPPAETRAFTIVIR
jgi:inhibitor of cysteine peptidase